MGQICQPATKRSRVAILLVHGGGGSSGRYHEMDGWRFLYQANGYITFAVDYRLATASDTSGYPEPEQDIKAAIQFLRSRHRPRHRPHRRPWKLGWSSPGRNHPYDPGRSFSGANLWADVPDAADGFIGFYGDYDQADVGLAGLAF